MKLIVETGSSAGNKYSVTRDIRLGRDVSNDIVLADPSVSLVHCQVEIRSACYFIQDLGSTNGIRLNGKRVINAELFDGDVLTIGQNEIKN